MDEQLTQYIALAADAVLTERENAIVDMRCGLSDGESLTLAEVGKQYGLSRERIRQIQYKASSKIWGVGRRHIRQGKLDAPCALLLRHVEDVVRLGNDADLDRLWDLVRDEPAPVRTLVLRLLGIPKTKIPEYANDLRARDRAFRMELREKMRAQRASDSFRNFLQQAIAWPRTTRILGSIPSLQRRRNVSEDGDGDSGSFVSAKLGREVQFESGLELDLLLKLESLPDVVAYQEQPFVLDYYLDGIQRRYYPDVFFILKDGRAVVAEIKPRTGFALYINLVKWAALRQFCEREGYGLMVTDGRHPIQSLVRHVAPQEFQDAICAAVARGPLGWSQCKHIRDRYSVTLDDFLAVVLKQHLVLSLHPFTLRGPH